MTLRTTYASLLLTALLWSVPHQLFACTLCAAVGNNGTCNHSVHGLQAGSDGQVHDGDLAAFNTFGSGWTSTSSGTSSLGAPAKLTWSVVPDNTPLPTGLGEPVSNSNLIAFLDGVHHAGNSPGGSDLTQRDWWQLMNSAFERWDELSGIDFTYEPNDDGTMLGRTTSNSVGVLGTRGDHRIGGHSIDGQISPTFLAYNFFPNNADMVIDTDEINRWSNDTNNYRLFRNMMMHEIGHGIGLNHVEPTDQSKLMEPKISTAYDGPQFDDILGLHRLYGDANEEDGGNETYQSATMLGSILTGGTISIGTDAVDAFVAPGETDFVSIDDNSDVDFFRFSTSAAGLLDIKLTPVGPTYDEGTTEANATPFNAAQQANLTLTLYDTDGTSVLEFANQTGTGMFEMIDDYQLGAAGDYFVRVGGLSNAAQMFRLDITAVPEPATWLLVGLGVVATASTRRRA